MFGILGAAAVSHAGTFLTLEELMRELHQRMEKDGYKIVKSRSHRGRIGGPDSSENEIVRCDLVCDRGGRPYKCMATKHKTSTKKTNCPWKAKAVYRRNISGWVLTILCDQHNHAPGTPEPPTPSQASEAEDNDEAEAERGPRPDADTSAVMQLAGVSDEAMRLTGDTFQQFKTEYRKMAQADRLGILAQMQMRIAAIYAIQNEDMQREKRLDAQRKRHQQIEEQRVLQAAQGEKPRRRRIRPGQQLQSSMPQSECQARHQEQQQQQHELLQHQHLQHQPVQQAEHFHVVPQKTEFVYQVSGFELSDDQHESDLPMQTRDGGSSQMPSPATQ